MIIKNEDPRDAGPLRCPGSLFLLLTRVVVVFGLSIRRNARGVLDGDAQRAPSVGRRFRVRPRIALGSGRRVGRFAGNDDGTRPSKRSRRPSAPVAGERTRNEPQSTGCDPFSLRLPVVCAYNQISHAPYSSTKVAGVQGAEARFYFAIV